MDYHKADVHDRGLLFFKNWFKVQKGNTEMLDKNMYTEPSSRKLNLS